MNSIKTNKNSKFLTSEEFAQYLLDDAWKRNVIHKINYFGKTKPTLDEFISMLKNHPETKTADNLPTA